MRNEIQHRLDIFGCAVLAALPEGYVLPDQAYRDEIRLRGHPRPLVSEVDDAVLFLESKGRIYGLRTETGIKWSLTDAGRAWWERNQ